MQDFLRTIDYISNTNLFITVKLLLGNCANLDQNNCVLWIFLKIIFYFLNYNAHKSYPLSVSAYFSINYYKR